MDRSGAVQTLSNLPPEIVYDILDRRIISLTDLMNIAQETSNRRLQHLIKVYLVQKLVEARPDIVPEHGPITDQELYAGIHTAFFCDVHLHTSNVDHTFHLEASPALAFAIDLVVMQLWDIGDAYPLTVTRNAHLLDFPTLAVIHPLEGPDADSVQFSVRTPDPHLNEIYTVDVPRSDLPEGIDIMTAQSYYALFMELGIGL